MTKEYIYCGLCGHVVGEGHGYEIKGAMTQHFRNKHPKEYDEIREARIVVRSLEKKYRYDGY